jgi:cation transporter-like permease
MLMLIRAAAATAAGAAAGSSCSPSYWWNDACCNAAVCTIKSQAQRHSFLRPVPRHTKFLLLRNARSDDGKADEHSVQSQRRSSILQESWVRGRWLLALLLLQSSSSAVLERFEDLIEDHIVITFFLTMLVGAGGNAGNQSAINVIRALAVGEVDANEVNSVIGRQIAVGFLLGAALAVGGFVRVYTTNSGSFEDAVAISASLFAIVFTSCILGSFLPLFFARLGVDPANAGTTIQVRPSPP